MTGSVKRTVGTPKGFTEFRKTAAAGATAGAQKLDKMKGAAADKIEHSRIANAWKKAQQEPWDSDTALFVLLDQVSPWRATQLESVSQSVKAQATLVHSLDALFERLATGAPGGKITPQKAREQQGTRNELLDAIGRLRAAIDDAGDAANSFPMAQLDRIEDRLYSDIDALEATAEKGARQLTPALQFAALDKQKQPGKLIGQLLGDEKLGAQLEQLLKAKDADKDLRTNLAALALLVDEASNAPDYAATGKGWFHPSARKDYRQRTHDSWSRYTSADRQKKSIAQLKKDLSEVAKGGKSAAEVLVSSFLGQLGLSAAEHKGWNVQPSTVRDALQGEAFLPLRALNETKQTMTKGDAALLPLVEKTVSNITQHILEGDFAAWRIRSSKNQLSGLNKGLLETWKDHHTSAHGKGKNKLTTREEDGRDLLWVTKIGGPSHGFDYGGECLLPLLCNGRTRAILVDDPKWPHNACARSYLRLLHQEDGSPILYLEPFQRDFPHIDKFGDAEALDDHIYGAIMKHAVEKAQEMGLPLSIGVDYEGVAEQLGLDVKVVHDPLQLKASNGVFEASDTLSDKHDWAQTEDEMTVPLERLRFDP